MSLKNWKLSSIFLFIALSPLQAIQLSQKAQISLITGSPGSDLYTLFGHSAIRVYDPFYGLDILYNYGTFDFNTPNFYLKFAQGKLKYSLSKDYYQAFVIFYTREGRSVFEQVLDLDETQKQALFDFLEENFKPENRLYLYDFFLDNCASRIRDVFTKVFRQDIQFDLSTPSTPRSFKDLITPYLKDPWVELGIYLILGSPSDKVASRSDYMFLPDYLNSAFSEAKIKKGNQFVPLVKENKTVFQAMVARPIPSIWSPTLVFWLIFGFGVFCTYIGYRRKKIAKWADFVLFFTIGLIGLFFLLMWFGTDHKALPWNLNMLWALPTHSIFAFFIFKKEKPSFMQTYWLITLGILTMTLLGWFILPQRLHSAVIPIILLLMLRAFYEWKN